MTYTPSRWRIEKEAAQKTENRKFLSATIFLAGMLLLSLLTPIK